MSFCHFIPLLSLLLLLLLIFTFTAISPSEAVKNPPVPAFFVFGDSTADPGNNNYINTVFKSNFWPYGRDLPNHVPTGRFTNGRLPSDFIASYVGLKDYVPPYLDHSLGIDELMTGVSFASAGSGFGPSYPPTQQCDTSDEQLEYFKEYQQRLEMVIGKERTKEVVANALYLVSAGTNDYVVNYFAVPTRRKNYDLESYLDFLLQQKRQFMQGLLDQGARRIGVAGLPPMGCLPMMITLNAAHPILQRGCVDFFSLVATHHNEMLQTQLKSLQLISAELGTRILYLDVYGPLFDMINQTDKYDFKVVSSGCCGTGLMEAAFLCNPESYVCLSADNYMFWDSMHPTEKTYRLLFESLRSNIDYLVQD